MFIQLRRESVAIPVVGGYAIIDSDMLETVLSYNWYTHSEGYIRTDSGKREFLMLHQLVAGIALPPWTIDHINRNKIDNRRINLRLVTKSANNYNRDILPAKGYYWRPDRGNWVVRFTVGNRLKYFGTYYSEQEAKEQAEKVYAKLKAEAFSAD